MSSLTIEYEMSDALAVQAVREDCVALVREHVSARDALVILGSAAVFALAVSRESHWLWWLAGLPPLIFLLLGVGWLFAFFWLPNVPKAKLSRLPNRRVQIEASETSVSFTSATELLEVAWSELNALKRRPNFWFVCLKSGARIPIPAQLLTQQALSFFGVKLAATGHHERKAVSVKIVVAFSHAALAEVLEIFASAGGFSHTSEM